MRIPPLPSAPLPPRPRRRALLALALCAALAGCGNGTLADIWDSFPEEAFNPPGDDGGGGGGGGGVSLTEVAALAGGQGVTGTVKNIALATVSSDTYAFLAAGTDGCHIVDVTNPDLINAQSVLATIPGPTVAGAKVDALAVVDGVFLVCVAVAPGAPNAVTVFHLPTLISAASSGMPLSGAVIPPAGMTDAIAVPGDMAGKGGGVSGAGGAFFVATGTALAHAMITGAPPAGTWTLVSASLPLGTPGFTNVTDVAAQTTAVYASGKRTDGQFGLVVIPHPSVPLPQPPVFIQVDSEVQRVIDDFISTAGNYPLDLAIDTLSLYVTGNAELFVFNITNPFLPALTATVPSTGSKTIAVAGGTGVFAVGAGDAVRAGTNVLGQARIIGSLTVSSTFTIRGVAIRSTDDGVFALVCAGTGGIRVVEIPRSS
jgi:hypothetical protein